MKELLALLESLAPKMEAAEALLGSGKDLEENKKFTAELNKITKEINATQAQIKELKAEEKAQAEALATAKALKLVPKPQTAGAGGLTASEIQAGNDNIINDPKLGFKNYGDCAVAVHDLAVNGIFDPRLKVIGNNNPELEAAGLRQGNGPEGGFLVPPAFRPAELEAPMGMSLDLYGSTRNFTLGKEESLSIPAIDEKSRKNGSRWGGVSSKWLEEEATKIESQPTFRQVTLRPKEIAVFVKVSDKLLRNSPIALGQFLSMASTDEITFRLSDAVLNGDGVGKPKGILKSGALVSVAKTGSQGADTVVVENTTDMLAKFTRRWLSGARWYINKDVMSQLQLMTIGDRPVFIPGGSIAGQPLATLHGLPIVETEYNEVLGDKGDILLTNLMAYITAQHGGGIRSDSSIHFNFDQNKTAFRFVTEADGQTWANNAITDFKGSGTTSPYVTLDERT